ncbi:Uncharacterised protein [Mycobacteroides abscessus subsp. abscessus]|nr:Uncharacterised protein [Mycobacteroides abscessus subsp. abscessus]
MATIAPMCSGAPDCRMYERTCGAKNPPAPAPTGLVNGTGSDNAHMAFDSDCFSHAIASTRLWTPANTNEAATLAVEPPTEPAVCTRISRLPTAPRASAMASSGIIEPSKRSGALPMTIASISSMLTPASARAASIASRHIPAIVTSCRLATYLVCPVPRTAARLLCAISCRLPQSSRRSSNHRCSSHPAA